MSGQIRYASQKRVLVEIALIKLCRPQMETGLDSILDRVRVLEEKLEQGSFVPAGSAAVPRAEAGLEGEETEEPPVLRAAPEDLKEIRTQWKMIVGRTAPPLKIYLQSAVPKYDGATGEAKLFLLFRDKTAQLYVNRPEKIEEIRQAIRETVRKDVEVEILLSDGADRRGLADIPVEELLREAVRMPVEIEEDPDEDE